MSKLIDFFLFFVHCAVTNPKKLGRCNGETKISWHPKKMKNVKDNNIFQ